ncbi:MAG: glycerophosphodiester phosphodiesterase [Frankiaceae bacterium]
MRVLGHRGCVHPGPENTVAAVRAAMGAGADGVEVDVRRSADGGLMCSHDPVVQGLTVLATTAAELGRRDVPTVSQVRAAAGPRATVVLEVKNIPGQPDFDAPAEATAHALVGELAGLTPQDRAGVVVSSFDWFALDVVRESGLEVPVAFLTLPLVAVKAGVAYAGDHGYRQLHASVQAVLADRDSVRRAHDAGLQLVAWTVADTVVALRLRDQGVDAVICDDPAAVVAALA